MRWAWLARLVTIGLVAALVVWGLGTLDLAQIGSTLRRADPLLLSTAVPALLVLCFLLRAARFHTMVGTLPAPPAGAFRFFESARALSACQAANNLVPLRLGELVRTRDLVAKGYPLGPVVVMQIAEKAIEFATLLLCALPLLPLGLVRLPALPTAALTVGGVALAGFALWRWRSRIQDTRVLAALADRRALSRAMLYSILADTLEIVLIVVCLRSIGLAPGWLAAAGVLVGMNLAIALPSTPAQLGAFEAGTALSLTLFGVGAEQAVAFALLYRVVQWGPATLVGSVFWLAPRRRVRPAAELSGSPPASALGRRTG